MASEKIKRKRTEKRCKSFHGSHDDLTSNKYLISKRTRPKSTGHNLDILDRKYHELREIVLGSIAARLPIENLLFQLATHGSKKWEDILLNRQSQILSLEQYIQAQHVYRKAFCDYQVNCKRELKEKFNVPYLPPVLKSKSKCGTNNHSDIITKHENEDQKAIKKKRKDSIRRIKTSASTSSIPNASDQIDFSYHDIITLSFASIHQQICSLRNSKLSVAFDSKNCPNDDTYRWNNCNQEISNWLRSKNKILKELKSNKEKLAKEEDERLERERQKLEDEKLTSREKVRAWLIQRKRINKNSMNKSSVKPVTKSESVKDKNNLSPSKIQEDKPPNEKLVMNAILFDETVSHEVKDQSLIKNKTNIDFQSTKMDRGNTKDASDIMQLSNNSNTNQEPEDSDFKKLLADFVSESNHEPLQQRLNSNFDAKDVSEALIEHEINLNHNAKVNEWLYDSGSLVENCKIISDHDKNESIDSKKSYEINSVKYNFFERKKSIKLSDFDNLRNQVRDSEDNSDKFDLEKFNTLIIHDDDTSGSKIDIYDNIFEESYRYDYNRDNPYSIKKDVNITEKINSDSNVDFDCNVSKAKIDLIKFDKSFSSNDKNDLLSHNEDALQSQPYNHGTKISQESRPKTSRRRLQTERI